MTDRWQAGWLAGREAAARLAEDEMSGSVIADAIRALPLPAPPAGGHGDG